MRRIAMRCTQEQFKSIKDRLKCEIYNLSDFKESLYLINDYFGSVTNLSNTGNKNREVYETFDAEIFLRACDSWEEEKIWKGSELQHKNINGKWVSCSFDTEFRIKPQPNYTKEIEALQLKAKENGMKCIINFEKI